MPFWSIKEHYPSEVAHHNRALPVFSQGMPTDTLTNQPCIFLTNASIILLLFLEKLSGRLKVKNAQSTVIQTCSTRGLRF